MLISAILILPLQAQIPDTSWTKTFGGSEADYGRQVQQTSDGGYIIFGFTNSFGAGMQDIYLIKTDSIGNLEWEKTYGTNNTECGESGRQVADGGYIILATTSDAPFKDDAYLLKVNSSGDTIWSKRYGGSGQDMVREVQQTTDLGYIFVGFTGSFGPGILYGPNVYLVKTDSLGNQLWYRAYGDTTWDMGFSVQQTTDGGYIIAGITDYFHYDTCDVYLIKTDANGDTVWSKTYGGSGEDYGERVRQTSDGGYIIVGESNSFGAGDYDIYVIKTDSLGNIQWTRTYGGQQDDCSMDVKEIPGRGYIIVGITASFGAGDYDVYLVRIYSNGDTVWTKTIGGSQTEYGRSICITNDNGYIVCGETSSYGAGALDVYLIKIEPDTLGINMDKDTRVHKAIEFRALSPQREYISVQYHLPRRCDVRIDIFDVSGSRLRTLTKEGERSGFHSMVLRTDQYGVEISSGVYFVAFKAQNFFEVKKVVLVK